MDRKRTDGKGLRILKKGQVEIYRDFLGTSSYNKICILYIYILVQADGK